VKAVWRTGDSLSRALLDVAASRPIEPYVHPNDEVLTLAHEHGLLGLLATNNVAEWSRVARPAFARLTARQQVMVRHLRRLLEAFHGEGIRAAILKGPQLALNTYRHSAHRTFTDIDVLVHPADLEHALKVVANDPAVPSIPKQGPKADKRNIPISDPGGVRFTLDLHWDLFSYSQLQGSAEGAIDWAWDVAEGPADQSELGPHWLLPEAAVLCFLCTHALLDHRFRLILFRDLKEAALHHPDWNEVGRFADKWGLRSTTYLALLMASRLTDSPVPAEVLADLRPRTTAIRMAELLLPRTNLVRFDGHRPHPLNLAIVLLHDQFSKRARLIARAPAAFPEWRRRVAGVNQPVAQGRNRPARQDTVERVSRVLHVLPVDLARGAQTYAKAMRDALDSSQVEHRTATIFRSEAGAFNADVDLGVAYGLGSRLGFSPRAMLRLRAYLRSWQPDVLVAHGGEALKYAAFAAGRSTKLAYYKIGSAQDLLRNSIRRTFHRMLVRRADLVAGVSNEMVDEAQHLLGAREDRTVYIPNGRDPSLFWNVASPTGLAPVRFVFVGHLTRTKRPQLFTDVIGALRRRGVDAHGVVVGEGPLLEECRRSAPAWVEFLGRRDDVPKLLSECDVFLFTSLVEGEGMPGVLIEAGLAGLPTVSTDVPGARTVIDDGVTGLVVAVDDVRAFVDAAERLARHPDLRVAMGNAARARCLELFTLRPSIELWQKHLANMFSHAGDEAHAHD
jgi:glycosyltransferase involved in cell wall biosynthesis